MMAVCTAAAAGLCSTWVNGVSAATAADAPVW
ncbi:hypothetical protein MSS2_02150 [Mycobacterium marinum]|nr:hypothetical protein MSS2_02150 [Mycobacterium marinum]RFZ68034.1 hypothetical protein DE4576_01967 [Mycobacterium marinum]